MPLVLVLVLVLRMVPVLPHEMVARARPVLPIPGGLAAEFIGPRGLVAPIAGVMPMPGLVLAGSRDRPRFVNHFHLTRPRARIRVRYPLVGELLVRFLRPRRVRWRALARRFLLVCLASLRPRSKPLHGFGHLVEIASPPGRPIVLLTLMRMLLQPAF
ncbi:hypothetical protein Mapa_009156 [Marchantia paleacea]|nr:hypothetical protein Mapa_009156 [Marchantia paleacea]